MNDFVKTKKQEEATQLFLDEKNLHILLEGGSRSAKTTLAIYIILMRALRVRSNHLILRFHLNAAIRSLWKGTIPKTSKLINKNLYGTFKKNESLHYLEIPAANGGYSEIWLGGTDDKDRVEKILGNEYSTIYFNEVSQVPHSVLGVFESRLAEKNDLRNYFIYDQNPGKKSHWTYKKWHRKINPEDGLPLKNPERYASILMNPEDNKENLDAGYFDILNNMSEKDRKRFKDGQYSEENEGKVFKEKWINRTHEILDFDRIVVALDPAVTNNDKSDEFGIVVVGKKGDYGYILEDASGKYTPNEWAKLTVKLLDKWKADKVVAEANNGGDMIYHVLQSERKFIPYQKVYATRGKVKRAEPVASVYENGNMYHVGYFQELEEEMIEFDYEEDKNLKSPNRCDAMCWGVAYLFNIMNGGQPRIRSL